MLGPFRTQLLVSIGTRRSRRLMHEYTGPTSARRLAELASYISGGRRCRLPRTFCAPLVEAAPPGPSSIFERARKTYSPKTGRLSPIGRSPSTDASPQHYAQASVRYLAWESPSATTILSEARFVSDRAATGLGAWPSLLMTASPTVWGALTKATSARAESVRRASRQTFPPLRDPETCHRRATV